MGVGGESGSGGGDDSQAGWAEDGPQLSDAPPFARRRARSRTPPLPPPQRAAKRRPSFDEPHVASTPEVGAPVGDDSDSFIVEAAGTNRSSGRERPSGAGRQGPSLAQLLARKREKRTRLPDADASPRAPRAAEEREKRPPRMPPRPPGPPRPPPPGPPPIKSPLPGTIVHAQDGVPAPPLGSPPPPGQRPPTPTPGPYGSAPAALVPPGPRPPERPEEEPSHAGAPRRRAPTLRAGLEHNFDEEALAAPTAQGLPPVREPLETLTAANMPAPLFEPFAEATAVDEPASPEGTARFPALSGTAAKSILDGDTGVTPSSLHDSPAPRQGLATSPRTRIPTPPYGIQEASRTATSRPGAFSGYDSAAPPMASPRREAGAPSPLPTQTFEEPPRPVFSRPSFEPLSDAPAQSAVSPEVLQPTAPEPLRDVPDVVTHDEPSLAFVPAKRETNIDRANERIFKLQTTLRSAETQIARLESAQADWRSQTERANRSLERKTRDHDRLRDRLEEEQKKLRHADDARRSRDDDHAEQIRTLERKITELQSDVVQLHEERETSKERLAAAKKANPSAAIPRDDLKVLYGVGPRFESVLNREGIVSLSQLAELDAPGVETLANKLGIRPTRIRRDAWVKNAQAILRAREGASDVDGGTEPPSDGDSTAPDSTAPDSTAPDSTAPDSTAPDSTAPDSTAPDSTAPDSLELGDDAPRSDSDSDSDSDSA